jgi:hypothetical protein
MKDDWKNINNLQDLKPGTIIRCSIRGQLIEGKIQKQGPDYFICQNVISGADCEDKLGYLYSWCVVGGDIISTKNYEVTQIEIYNEQSHYEILLANISSEF